VKRGAPSRAGQIQRVVRGGDKVDTTPVSATQLRYTPCDPLGVFDGPTTLRSGAAAHAAESLRTDLRLPRDEAGWSVERAPAQRGLVAWRLRLSVASQAHGRLWPSLELVAACAHRQSRCGSPLRGANAPRRPTHRCVHVPIAVVRPGRRRCPSTAAQDPRPRLPRLPRTARSHG